MLKLKKWTNILSQNLDNYIIGDKPPDNLIERNKNFGGNRMDKLEILLMKLDIEIGSTINSNDDANVVLNNMERANQILQEIKELYNIKF